MSKELIAIIQYMMINNIIYFDEKRIVNCYKEKEKIKIVYEDGTHNYIEIKHK